MMASQHDPSLFKGTAWYYARYRVPYPDELIDGLVSAFEPAGHGFDTLSVLTSERSPGYELLRALARRIDAFDLWTPGLEPPPGHANRGLYTDLATLRIEPLGSCYLGRNRATH